MTVYIFPINLNKANKLLYTAIARAKKKAYIVGQWSAFKHDCTNIDKTKINTFLE